VYLITYPGNLAHSVRAIRLERCAVEQFHGSERRPATSPASNRTDGSDRWRRRSPRA